MTAGQVLIGTGIMAAGMLIVLYIVDRRERARERQRIREEAERVQVKQPAGVPTLHDVWKPTMALDGEVVAVKLNEMEASVLHGIAKEQDMRAERIMVQALRVYQMVHERAKLGQDMAWTRGGELVREPSMLLPEPSTPPDPPRPPGHNPHWRVT